MNAENIVDFTLELSEREIYNDIRTECDILEILTVRPDATPEFFDSMSIDYHTGLIRAGETREFRIYAPAEHVIVRWQNAWISSVAPETIVGSTQGWCEGLDGWWRPWGSTTLCSLPDTWANVRHRFRILGRYNDDRYIWVEYESRSDYDVRAVITAEYLALSPEKRFIKMRSVNETSIELYGRRPMDLVWPLGQHPNQMQGILDRYCQRHCMVTQDEYGDVPEPICTAKATIAGKNEELAEDLLTYRIASHISVRGDTFAIPLVHPSLGLDGHRWYINAINITDHVEGILEGTFELEQQRAMERPRIFRLQSDPPDADRDSRLYDATPEENHVLG